jgi:hypothetical protein
MNDVDLSANAAWQAYQKSIGDEYQDAINKAFNDQYSVLPDTGNPNLERATKEYELDKLFGIGV